MGLQGSFMSSDRMGVPTEAEPPLTEDLAPPAGDISRLAEHLFRHESGKLVSVLTGIFGIERLQFAEDVVQEALVRALQTWPYYGIPKNPAAWLTQTAKNIALDLIRREKLFRDKQPQIITFIEQWSTDPGENEHRQFDSEIKDQRLRLMFACCHPSVPQDSQAALALKTLCGFGASEIASAFLTTEAAVEKRLVRARQRIRELRLPFEIPAGEELAARLESVLQTLYLLFNEGYKASTGDKLIREDLCDEAIRLAELLAQSPVGNQPRVHALAALMFLNAARLPARVDEQGNILRLKEQNRVLWDRAKISRGMFYLAQSASGDQWSEYHLQAAIAACHCSAPNYASTDWAGILALYDQLLLIDNSPVVALNRAVAVAQVHGAEAGIKAVQSISNKRQLDSYYLLHAVMAEFESQLDNPKAAANHLRKALELTDLKSEQLLLSRRLEECRLRSELAAMNDCC